MVSVKTLRAPAALLERGADEVVSYNFELRTGKRRATSGPVTATFVDVEDGFRIASVELIDDNSVGSAFRAPTPVRPGTAVSLYASGTCVPSLTTRVTRCTPDEAGGYVMGVASAPPRRAA